MQLESLFPYLMLTYFAIQVASMPVWFKILVRFGKHKPWAVSWALPPFVSMLILLLDPGTKMILPLFLIVAAMSFLAGGGIVVPVAILGDIVDYDILKSGSNRAGVYFAFYTLLQKFSMGAGMGIGLPMLTAFGYQLGGENDSLAIFGLVFTYLAPPALFSLMAAAVIWGFPIDARRHRIIVRRIKQRSKRVPAI